MKNPLTHKVGAAKRRVAMRESLKQMKSAAAAKLEEEQERQQAMDLSVRLNSPTSDMIDVQSLGLDLSEQEQWHLKHKASRSPPASPKLKRKDISLDFYDTDNTRPASPRRAYVKKVDEMKIVPELFGVVHHNNKTVNEINLRNYGVGDRRAEAIAVRNRPVVGVYCL